MIYNVCLDPIPPWLFLRDIFKKSIHFSYVEVSNAVLVQNPRAVHYGQYRFLSRPQMLKTFCVISQPLIFIFSFDEQLKKWGCH